MHLRGVYLATLFMQGVETASMANDACGVPLPWMMTNPWLFFDGKLFHLKLKMSTYVQTLRDLCDDQIDVVLKIERFRKAILEDVEHYLLPAHMGNGKYTNKQSQFSIKSFHFNSINSISVDPLYRAGIIQPSNLAQAYGKNQIHPIANIPSLSNGSSAYYNAVSQHQQHPQSQQGYYSNVSSNRNVNYRNRYGNGAQQQALQAHGLPRQAINRQGGYQLKVGGVVVGSWAGGAPNRDNVAGVQARLNRAAGTGHYIRYPINARSRTSVNARLQRNVPHNQHVSSLARTISRNTYGVKANRNRNRRNRKERKGPKPSNKTNVAKKESDEEKNDADGETEANEGESAEGESVEGDGEGSRLQNG